MNRDRVAADRADRHPVVNHQRSFSCPGGDYNKSIEWSDYKHFAGDVKDYKIEAPAVKP